MKVEQIYTGCLAQGAYYIESKGEAIIVDPLREVQSYIDRAEKDGAKIKYILETHFHADFVSGHLTLAEKTGAPIVYGPTAQPNFEAIIAEDGQVLELGDVKIKVLHTPGHTMESTTFLLMDEQGKDYAIFTGDTLFLGDVGRPDLAQKAAHMTQEELAATLYRSLREKIMPLADDVIVYPGHGAGSACGKNMSDETVDTLGSQKETNYALRADMTEQEFVQEVTDGLLAPPAYFPMNVMMNKMGYKSFDKVLEQGMHKMTAREFEVAANETEAVVLDVRGREAYSEAHVPRSIFIGLDGDFAPWVGGLIQDVKQPILLVAHDNQLEETITRLSRVGFDHVLGYLEGGIPAWKEAGKDCDQVENVTAEQLQGILAKDGQTKVADVRKASEYLSEHIEGAFNTPLIALNDHLAEYKSDDKIYVHCAGGYRSMIAASILKSRGFHHIVNVQGGFSAIKKTAIKVTDYVCPSTL